MLASLKWCYLHIKEQDWESWNFLAKLCYSGPLCYSHSWRSGQIHICSTVININLNLAEKKKVNSCSQVEVSVKVSFMRWSHQSHGWLEGSRYVSIYILLHSHPPYTVGPLSRAASRELKQLLTGRAVQAIMLAPLKLCPWPTHWKYAKHALFLLGLPMPDVIVGDYF